MEERTKGRVRETIKETRAKKENERSERVNEM